MLPELKILGLRVLCLVIVAPIMGAALLQIVQKIEKAWKSGRKKEKFFALTFLVIFIAISFGWLL